MKINFLKKYPLIQAFALFAWAALSAGMAFAGDPWLNGFAYRHTITLNNGGTAIMNYQVGVTTNTALLIAAGKMQASCQDVRFTDSDGTTQLSNWLESGCNTAATLFWVRISSVPAGVKTIYMYYGNTAAAAASGESPTFYIMNRNFDYTPLGRDWTCAASGAGACNAARNDDYTSAPYSGFVYETGRACERAHLYQTVTLPNISPLYLHYKRKYWCNWWGGGLGIRINATTTNWSDGTFLRSWGCGGSSYSSPWEEFWDDISAFKGMTTRIEMIYHDDTDMDPTYCNMGDHGAWLRVDDFSITTMNSNPAAPSTTAGAADSLVTKAGLPTNWTWKVPLNAEKVPSGSAVNWNWVTFQDDSSALTPPRGTAAAWQWGPPPPTAGGEWVLVPGSSSLGTSDFYIMKYEAKNVGGFATSQADVTPWANLNHPAAITACAALGPGYHLPTIAEVQTINRNIEAQTANWADGTIGSLVSAGGGLKRGNAGQVNSVDYNGADPEFGTGRDAKAKLVLSNGGEIWDWSGNLWEFFSGTGANGTFGTPGGVTFDTTGASVEWSTTTPDLNQERPIIGPSNSSWNSGNGMGYYFGEPTTSGLYHGGFWNNGAYTGVYAFNGDVVSFTNAAIGFRCAK